MVIRVLALMALLSVLACDSDAPESRSSAATIPDDCVPPECEIVVGVPEGESPAVPEISRPPQDEIPCNNEDEDLDGTDYCGPDDDRDGVPVPLDCDDSDPARNPLAAEIRCDTIDQNCDGLDDCDSDADGTLDRDDCAPGDPSITIECRIPATAEPLE